MDSVQIYIDNKRISLFKDENIIIKSTVQDVNDISKVFTDHSQTFSIPADSNNNDILGYYYNNDLDVFNANTRVEARIEVNHTPFRSGKIQLEGSIVENGQVASYKVTFYGDLVSLKDKFGDDRLRDLDYSSINTVYSGDNVMDTITNTNYLDVRYPLISSSRKWQYSDSGAVLDNINFSTAAIDYRELFPAISDSKIMQLIADKYNIQLEGNFLSDERFKSSYTWWKNRESTGVQSAPVDLEFNPSGLSCNPSAIPNQTLGVNTINLNYVPINTVTFSAPQFQGHISQSHRVQVYISPTTTGTYFLDMYDGGVLVNTFEGNSGQWFYVADEPNMYGLNRSLTFKMRADTSFTFDFQVKYTFIGQYYSTNVFDPYSTFSSSCSYDVYGVNVPIVTDYSFTAPDISVSDWFSGTLKQFHLTCYPIDLNGKYQVEPLDVFYKNGDTVDITPYVDMDKIMVDRVKLYREVSFEYHKSKSFMNETFFENNNRRYGDLNKVFPEFDGGKYAVKLPFETMLFNKFDDTDLQVGYCLTKAPDFKPYIPQPVKLYLQNSKQCSFWFRNETTPINITNYMAFGQDTEYNSENYSINFGEEVSSLILEPVTNSLYKTQYQSYLSNFFNSKTRKVTVKCKLPIHVVSTLSLDDAVIIRDKKYRVNSNTTNLRGGESTLVLISDFNTDTSKYPPVVKPATSVDDVYTPMKPPKGGWIIIKPSVGSSDMGTPSITLPATMYDEFIFKVTMTPNITGLQKSQLYEIEHYNSSGQIVSSDMLIIKQDSHSARILTESGEYILTEDLNRILI